MPMSEAEDDGDTIWQALEPRGSSRPTGRCGHVALPCGKGKRLVVIGGYNAEGILDDIWALDLNMREWSRVAVDGPSPPPRAFFRGCSGPPPGGDVREDGDAFAYIFGGSDAAGNFSNDLWCLDIENRTWGNLHAGELDGGSGTAIPCPRSNHAMCRMGNILAVHGGESSSGEQLNDLWLFNPVTASWNEACISRTGPRPCPRSSHCLAITATGGSSSCFTEKSCFGGSLIVFGGLGGDGSMGAEGDAEEDRMPLNDLWVLSPVLSLMLGLGAGSGPEGGITRVAGDSQTLPVWSLVMLEGVGPSPRSLSALAARRPPPHFCSSDGDESDGNDRCDRERESHGTAELFIFGGYGLVELPSGTGAGNSVNVEQDSDEEGDIIMAYIDDLWGLSLNVQRSSEEGVDANVDTVSNTSAASDCVVTAGGIGWVDEEEMGFAGPSSVEGRNGHTLTWCGDKLILFGGFVGDAFDAGVHVAEVPSMAALE